LHYKTYLDLAMRRAVQKKNDKTISNL